MSFSKQIEEASQRMAAILERMDSSSQAAQQTIQAFGSIRESVELLQHLADGYMEHIAKINEASVPSKRRHSTLPQQAKKQRRRWRS